MLCMGYSWNFALQAGHEFAEWGKYTLPITPCIMNHVALYTSNWTVFICLFQSLYRAKGIEHFKNFSVVTDTPVYETCKQSAQNLSEVRFLKTLITELQIIDYY